MLLTDEEIGCISHDVVTNAHTLDYFARAVIAAYENKLLDQKPNQTMVECVTGKPIYQVWRSTDSCGEFYSWDDCDKYDYDETLGDNRRVLFEHPAPSANIEVQRFLTDVVTAAGLLRYGKTDKALATRISDAAYNIRMSAPTGSKEAMSALQIATWEATQPLAAWREMSHTN